MQLGTIGIWSLAFTHGDRVEARDAATELFPQWADVVAVEDWLRAIAPQ